MTAYATALGTATEMLYTTGPVRSGFISFNEYVTISNAPDPPTPNSVSITIGSLNATCSGNGFPYAPCTGSLGPYNGAPHPMLPFTLGEPFTFTESADIDATASLLTGIVESGNASGNFTFTLLEADGTTPVPMYLAPEPASAALLALGCAALAMSARRRFTTPAPASSPRRY